MAKIRKADTAPDGRMSFSLGSYPTFELVKADRLETNDPVLIAAALNHPYLDVDEDTVDVLGGIVFPSRSLDPEDDALSAENSVAFDPAHVREDTERVLDMVNPRTGAEPVFFDEDKSVDVVSAHDTSTVEDRPEDTE